MPPLTADSGMLETDAGMLASLGTGVTIIEDFEGDVFEANGGAWSGDVGDFDIVTSPAGAIANGSNALHKAQTGTFSQIKETKSSDDPDLNAYATQGDHFRYYFYADNTNVRFIFRHGDSAGSQYNVWAHLGNGDFVFYVDSTQLAADTSVTYSTGTLYYINYRWDDGSTFGGSAGDHDIELRQASDDSLVSDLGITNDTSHTGGNYQAISMDGMNTGENAYADYLHIRNR